MESGQQGQPHYAQLHQQDAAESLTDLTGFPAQDFQMTEVCDKAKVSECKDVGYQKAIIALAEGKLVLLTTSPVGEYPAGGPLLGGITYHVGSFKPELGNDRGAGFNLRDTLSGKTVDCSLAQLGRSKFSVGDWDHQPIPLQSSGDGGGR
jgi:hypothetical protein